MHIPFLEQLFSGAVISDYEVSARSQAPKRILKGQGLPDMRVVTAISSVVVHSGDRSKKRPARIVVETADGEDVADQGIKARAHILGAPRKPCAKKAASKRKATSKKKTAPRRKYVPVKKKKAVEESI